MRDRPLLMAALPAEGRRHADDDPHGCSDQAPQAGLPGAAGVPRRVARILTRDADEHHAWIATRYGDHRRTVRAHRRGFAFFSASDALGSLTVTSTSYRAATAEVAWQPVPYVLVGQLLSGRYLHRWQGGEVRLADRGVLMFPPHGYTHLHDCSETDCVTISLAPVLRVAEESTGLAGTEVRFTGLRPISPAAERQWSRAADYVRRGVYTRSLDHPLLVAAAEQLVAASLLSTFPNTTMTIEVRTARDPGTPALVRRAKAFIDAQAGQPITVSDIAAAVGVVPRTLQYAFRRHGEPTPSGYLRRVRLARAHEDLVAAQPGDGTTVAMVAARWGYPHPQRFAAAYRRVYGRPPQKTPHA